MKKFVVTAAALMLGTSAMAWMPMEKAQIDGATAATAKSDWDSAKSPLTFSSFDDKQVMKAESAAIETSSTLAKGAELGGKEFAKWDEDGTLSASADAGMKSSADETQTASADASGKTGWTGSAEAGMGGPLEVAEGYPPCSRTVTDRCIQLYERGVRESLAAWKASDENVGMGGPLEPVAAGSKEEPSAGTDHAGMDHSAMPPSTGESSAAADTMSGKPAATTSDAGTATAKPGTMDSMSGTGSGTMQPMASGGVGGPLETRGGYPPCSRTVTDRCIQLYERGVSGQGN